MSTIRVIRNRIESAQIKSDSSNDTYIMWKSALEKGAEIKLFFETKNNYLKKSGDDLLIYSIFPGEKVVTTTVQDYFKFDRLYNGKNFLSIQYDETLYDSNDEINNAVTAEQKIAGYITDTSEDDIIFGTKGKNKFSIFNGGNDKIYDVEGDDTYQLSVSEASKTTTILDYKGNDKYTLNSHQTADITDGKGNDTYKAYDSALLKVTDKKGNDKYTLKATNFTVTDNEGKDSFSISGAISAASRITDSKGDDKYNINAVSYDNNTANIVITDKDGADKYTINNSAKVTINETFGNDTYTLNTADNILVKDDGGKDTYTISYSENTTINDIVGKDNYKVSYGENIHIVDGISNDTKGGNDKYSFKHLDGGYVVVESQPVPDANITDYYGKENYTFSYVKNAQIKDYQGSDDYKISSSDSISIVDYDNTVTLASNDKYNITDTHNVTIVDYSGNDNYTSASSKVAIRDLLGNDTYKVTEMPIRISNSGNDTDRSYILDEKGNDKYTFTNAFAKVDDEYGKDKYTISNSNVKITDNGGDSDTYTVKKLNSKVVINDSHGADDKLNLSSASKSNLVYMANYDLSTTSNYSDVKDGSLYILDRTKSGFVKIENFLKTSGGTITSGKGDGYIENIKAGLFGINNAIDNYTLSSSSVSALGQAVAEWQSNSNLSTNYGSIDAILNSENANDVAKFIAFVQNK